MAESIKLVGGPGSAGSGGPFDLVVILPGGGRLLQCKLCRETPTAGQIGRWLEALPDAPDGWSAELWVRTARGRQSYSSTTTAPIGRQTKEHSA